MATALLSRRSVVALACAGASACMLALTASSGHAQQAPKTMQDIRFVIFHKPGPAWLPGKSMFEQPGVRDHVAHYGKWREAGKLELGGPHLDAGGGGMMIPVAGVTEEEANRFANEDPAVKGGTLIAEVRPWLIGMSK
jgi:uncharacterized protein YciI